VPDAKKSRPKKTRRVQFTVDEDTYQKALKKAKSKKRMNALMRAWMRMFGDDDKYDHAIDPPDEIVNEEIERAPGGGRKKKSGSD